MMNFKKRNYKFWHSPLALALLFCILVFFGYRIIDLIKKEMDTAHEKGLVLDRINDLQNRKISLNNNIKRLETEEGKEEIIREKYQVAKPNEKIVTIVDESISNKSELEVQVINHGFWNWIKRVFKF